MLASEQTRGGDETIRFVPIRSSSAPVLTIRSLEAIVMTVASDTGIATAGVRDRPTIAATDAGRETSTPTLPVETTETGSARIGTLDATVGAIVNGTVTVARPDEMRDATMMTADSVAGRGTHTMTAVVEGGTDVTMAMEEMTAAVLRRRLPRSGNRRQI